MRSDVYLNSKNVAFLILSYIIISISKKQRTSFFRGARGGIRVTCGIGLWWVSRAGVLKNEN